MNFIFNLLKIQHVLSAVVNERYIGFSELLEGCYLVKSFVNIRVNGEKRVRVNLENNPFIRNRFIIIPKGFHQRDIDERSTEKDVHHLQLDNRNLFMHFWQDDEKKIGLYFFNCPKDLHYVDYESSKLCTLRELPGNGYYTVVLFSIVKIDNEDRIRVDVVGSVHFILPKNESQHNVQNLSENHNINKKTIKIEDIEYWNRQILRADVNTYKRDHITFNWYENDPYIFTKQMYEPQSIDEKEID